ncbi:conserved hypothetical protein [Solidesulfovibrio fructosivorans JJ]]|uniref:Uncharacterized protein n=1 Tax=Solidesulfovibrio fructosivorans JJ] TaxID=596151 RepID=E1JXE7_SOLFR|nr:alpha/beta hydrolase [Solidesulfovibrio fructosivorans]EFL50924.1 conserved hypothetical protein [Solidesulfovibrio fructosivorans JJ]]
MAKSHPSLLRPLALLLIMGGPALLLAACAKPNVTAVAHASPAAVLTPADKAGIRDGRARFREIMTAVIADHGAGLPGNRPADGDSVLWRLAGEPASSGLPVPMSPSKAGLRLVLVPGLLAQCVAQSSLLFEDARANVERQGYATSLVNTGGRLSCAHNAVIIRDAVASLPMEDKLVFVTHSKGAVDVLEALVDYPELVPRTAAVVSVAGAINGSPLADTFSDDLIRFVESMPLSSCPPGNDTEAIDSLRRPGRLRFLAEHPMQSGIRFYSLAAFATREEMSMVLKPFYDILAKTDPLNDGLVIASDAIYPGATLLGYPNADHLAVAMPFTKTGLLRALNTKNAYPRAALLEAIARYVEEDLAKK